MPTRPDRYRQPHDPAGAITSKRAGVGLEVVHVQVAGRARFRSPQLRGAAGMARRLETRLRAIPVFQASRVSHLTGSILLLFDPAVPMRTVRETVYLELAECVAAAGTDAAAAPVRTERRSDALITATRRAERPRGLPRPERPPRTTAVRWHYETVHCVLELTNSSPTSGLGGDEAAGRLLRHGKNSLAVSAGRSSLDMMLSQITSVPVLLLGASAGVAILTGGLADAAVILAVVVVNAGIGFITESYAENTINALTHVTSGNAAVVRDATVQIIAAELVVPGDILVLSPGNRVAADARLVRTQNLSVDESMLTGESLPVIKSAEVVGTADTPLGDRHCMVYMGTLVTGGSGLAVVVATGPVTEIGQIQDLVGETRAPQTPMQRQLDRMGRQLAILSTAVCAGVFGIGLVRGYGWLEMLKSSISLAVAAVPEGLPTVATTTLALGMRQLRRKGVLIRRLDAVETLGSVQAICLDKTGTLTENRMAVINIRAGEHSIAIAGGEFFDAGTRVAPASLQAVRQVLVIGALCNESEPDPGIGVYNGSPTENALLEAASLAGIEPAALRTHMPRLQIQYRDENHQYMTTLHAAPEGGYLRAVKGSPAEVIGLCRWKQVDSALIELSDDERATLLRDNEALAGNALRVLGFACASAPTPDDRRLDELIWLGMVGMADPTRPGMPELMRLFHRAGIRTLMITGDQSATAYAIGKELKLGDGDPVQILDSNRLDKLDPELLAGLVQKTHVFARVSPTHKLRIVQALQRAGGVVAMTGDGINDSPALRAADIGIAMGDGGTEAARTVADVIIEDNNLHSMVTAVEQGRTIYGNIRKAIHFLLATNFSEIEVMLASIALGLGQPLNPIQLLWINLITDIFPGLALALDAPEEDTLSLAAEKSRRTDHPAAGFNPPGYRIACDHRRHAGKLWLCADPLRPRGPGRHASLHDPDALPVAAHDQLPFGVDERIQPAPPAAQSLSLRCPGRLPAGATTGRRRTRTA